MTNIKLVDRIRSRQATFGLWMSIGNPIVAEIMSLSDADFLLVDGEHAPIPVDSLMQILPATERRDIPVLYRVHGNYANVIKGALDHGVAGVMVPMVNSQSEAREAISAAKYPPLGKRGFGPWRASEYYADQTTYLERANNDTLVIVQIESREAVLAIDDISQVKGVDVLYIGPADLALSLGIQPGVLHPEIVNACKSVADCARKNGKVAGIDITSLAFIPELRELGFTLFTYGADSTFLMEGARAAIAEARLQYR